MVVRFSLDRRFSRPVFYISIGGVRYRVLFDTGAFYPVYTGGNNRLMKFGGHLEQRNVSFGDFSGRCVGNLFRLRLSVGGLIYTNLPIISVDNETMPFDFIFSATMFAGFFYAVDDVSKILTIDTLRDDRNAYLRTIGKSGSFQILVGGEPDIDS